MEDKAHWNPVFAHLTRDPRWPSTRATLWLAAGQTLASLALTVFLMVRVKENPQFGYRLVDFLETASWGLHFVAPLVAAPLAAILTVHETRDEGFQLLRMTPGYSRGDTVRGLVLATLYRLRVLLVLMVALAPLVMVGPYRRETLLARRYCCVFVSRDISREEWEEVTWGSPTDAGDLTCIEPSDGRLLLGALMILLWPVRLWGVTVFGTALAVWLALWWGRSGWVWAYLVGVLLCVLVVLTLIGPAISRTFISNPDWNVAKTWPPPELEAAVLYSAVYYVLAWGVMRLARRWA